jgi:hypothetical protein
MWPAISDLQRSLYPAWFCNVGSEFWLGHQNTEGVRWLERYDISAVAVLLNERVAQMASA